MLRGAAPVLAGSQLTAILDHREGRLTWRSVSEHGDRLDPGAFPGPRCEHCGLRRRRAETFVVVHVQSGEIRQVGSGCLRDFVGGHDPERACRQAECLALARAELDRVDRRSTPKPAIGTRGIELEQFAVHAAHVLRSDGWRSREQARRIEEPATVEQALRSLQSTPDAIDDGDRALAEAALRWARALLPTK